MTNGSRLLPGDDLDAEFRPEHSKDDIFQLIDLVAGCTMKDLESLSGEDIDEAFHSLMSFIDTMDGAVALSPMSEYISVLRDPSHSENHDELRDHFRRLRIPLPPALTVGEWAPKSGE